MTAASFDAVQEEGQRREAVGMRPAYAYIHGITAGILGCCALLGSGLEQPLWWLGLALWTLAAVRALRSI